MKQTNVAKYYEFEGKQMTLKEIKAVVPFLSKTTLAAHIKAGRNTRAAITTFDPIAVNAAHARRRAKNRKDFIL